MEIPAQSAPDFRLTRPTDPPGKLNIYLTVVDGRVILEFSRPVKWVGFTADEAEKQANDILDAVRTARTLHLGGDHA